MEQTKTAMMTGTTKNGEEICMVGSLLKRRIQSNKLTDRGPLFGVISAKGEDLPVWIRNLTALTGSAPADQNSASASALAHSAVPSHSLNLQTAMGANSGLQEITVTNE